MGLIRWLRKLGILQSGAETAVYRNAKERPMSFQMGEAFYPTKDNQKAATPKETPPEKPAK